MTVERDETRNPESALTLKAGVVLMLFGGFLTGAVGWGVSTILAHENRITTVEVNMTNAQACFKEIKETNQEVARKVSALSDQLTRHDAVAKARKGIREE